MDDVLPTYATATSKDPWSLIAPYIDTQDLCNASLVCKKWYHVITPLLWGDPGVHFGDYSDLIYSTLYQFRKAISEARSATRALTHTLRLPTCYADLQLGPSPIWIQSLLSDLPRLQSLVASSCPFFDHASLLYLSGPAQSISNHYFQPSSWGTLRLLDASRCSNATSEGLCQALALLPQLVYLDLSYTSAAAVESVMYICKGLMFLQILKLRSTGLRDRGLGILAEQVRTRLRSLDIRDNNLTDVSIRSLLMRCFTGLRRDLLRRHQKGHIEYSQLWDLPEEPADAQLSYYNDTRLESYVRSRYTSGFVDHLAIEDDFDPGISHLYLEGNRFTAHGLSMLLIPRRLRVLDAGIFSISITSASASAPTELDDLIGTFATSQTKRLKYLRIGHEVVTRNQPVARRTPSVMSGSITSPRKETTNGNTYSLGSPSTSGATPAEDTMDNGAELGATSKMDALLLDEDQQTDLPRRNTVPEKAENSHEQLSRSLSVDISSPSLADFHPLPNATAVQATRLTPQMLPGLRTLVLCGVPKASTDANTSHRICDFIVETATESTNAAEKAENTYDLPPSQNIRLAQREHAKSLFALEQITLEIVPVTQIKTQQPSKQRDREGSITKSATEHPDSEAFWAASEQDFSFFNEDGWEQSSPSSKESPEKQKHRAVAVPSTAQAQAPAPADTGLTINTVDAIVKFRKEKKAAFMTASTQANTSEGSDGLDWWKLNVSGYWPGKITVMS